VTIGNLCYNINIIIFTKNIILTNCLLKILNYYNEIFFPLNEKLIYCNYRNCKLINILNEMNYFTKYDFIDKLHDFNKKIIFL